MPMKKYKPEQIVTLLRQIEVEIANGKTNLFLLRKMLSWLLFSLRFTKRLIPNTF